MRRVLLLLACFLVVEPVWASTPAEAAQIALKDIQKLPPDAQPNVRYFWAGAIAEKDRDTFWKVFLFHINSISRNADFVVPARVAEDVWRVDIREPEWKRETFEKLAALDPYFHVKLKNVVVPAVAVPAVPVVATEVSAGDTVRFLHDAQAYRRSQPTIPRGRVDAGTEFTVRAVSGDLLLWDSTAGEVWVRKADVQRIERLKKPPRRKGQKAQEEQRAQVAVVPPGAQTVGDEVTAAAPWLPTDTMTTLISLTQSQVPIVRADWFFVQTARQVDRQNVATGAGYYDFLQIKEEKDLEELAGLDRKTAERLRREIAAIIQKSGVTVSGSRQVFAIQDGYWETHDSDKNQGASNAVRQLDKDYKFIAKEVYFRLPNGLWGLAAVNAQNNQLANTVPDTIAGDKESTSNDLKIHAGLSCIRCHKEGLRPLDDYARRFYANPPGDAKLTSPDYERLKRLKRLYLGPLEDRYEDDQRYYSRVLLRLTGMKPGDMAKAYAKVWQTWAEDDVTGEQFALELGVDREAMIAAFKAYAKANGGQLDPILLGFLKRPEFEATRTDIEEVYPLAQVAVQNHKQPGKKEEEP